MVAIKDVEGIGVEWLKGPEVVRRGNRMVWPFIRGRSIDFSYFINKLLYIFYFDTDSICKLQFNTKQVLFYQGVKTDII